MARNSRDLVPACLLSSALLTLASAGVLRADDPAKRDQTSSKTPASRPVAAEENPRRNFPPSTFWKVCEAGQLRVEAEGTSETAA